jgi:hypothetical protein
MATSSGTDNVIAALGRSNRVRQISLWSLANRQLENVLAAMQVPFPELTELRLAPRGETLSIIPDSFLGGSAPRLQIFNLDGIPFPGLPNLLLSSNHLVQLWLNNIPHSGYISPEAIFALISVLSSLETLSLGFKSPQSRPDRQSRSLHPPKRSILPALNDFRFKGVTEYLEELVTRIDAPQIDKMHITFFNQIDFDCPRLAQFININCTPTLGTLDEARVQFDDNTAGVELRSQSGLKGLEIATSCREPDWQLSSIEQLCNSAFPPLSTIEDLYIEQDYWKLVWKNDAIENTLWLQLLLPFSAVKNLYLSEEFAPGIAATLRELVGGRITEVFPNLQNIFVEGLEASGPVPEKNIGEFVAALQLSGHPIAITDWDRSRGNVDDEVAVIDGEQQSTIRNCLAEGTLRWNRGQGSYSTSGRRCRSNETFVIFELR